MLIEILRMQQSDEFLFLFLLRKSLGERVGIEQQRVDQVPHSRMGNLEMAFSKDPKAKNVKQRERELQQHREERKQVIRPIKSLHLKKYVPKQ